MLKQKHFRFAGIFLCLCFIMLTCSCANEKKQTETIQAFASSENSENYIIRTEKCIYMHEKELLESDFLYEENPCEFVLLSEEGVYAYAYSPLQEYLVNILFISYDTKEITQIGTLQLPDEVIAVTHHSSALYFRTIDPATDEFRQIYYTFHLETGESSSVYTEELRGSLGYDPEYARDFNRSEKYRIESFNNNIFSIFHGNRISVTNKETGERKILNTKLLQTCEEGKRIYELGKRKEIGGFYAAYEQDGIVYVEGYHNTFGSFSGPSPCHAFIMKYNFEGHSFSYHTAVYFEDYPGHILEIYIPK